MEGQGLVWLCRSMAFAERTCHKRAAGACPPLAFHFAELSRYLEASLKTSELSMNRYLSHKHLD